jgi:hypothetical protein
MLMETSTNRYLPSLEYIEDDEGNSLMKIWAEIIKYMKGKKDQRVFFGFNWSVRSWGIEEEKTGFQSIPTKWHGMFWTWPKFENKNFDNNISNEKPDFGKKEATFKEYDFIDEKNTPLPFKKINGDTIFGKEIVSHFKLNIDKIKNKHEDNEVSNGTSNYKEGSLLINFNCDLESFLETEKIFQDFLKPIAIYLNEYFAELSNIFFDENDLIKLQKEMIGSNRKLSWSEAVDQILNKTSKEMISDEEYSFLQKLPKLKDDDEIRTSLNKKFSKEATEELLVLVKNRYSSNLKEGWRKGFGYTLALKEDENGYVSLKINPGAYLGPAGVVESLGILLKRPEDYDLPIDFLIKKSNELYKFGNKFPDDFE